MFRLFCASALLVGSLGLAQSGTDTKALTPAEAAKKIDQKVTMQMEVKSATLRGGVCFLNSEEDFKSDKNFTVFISKEGVVKFEETKLADPATHFKGKTIRVTGKVILYREKAEIVVDTPDQIETIYKEDVEKSEKKK